MSTDSAPRFPLRLDRNHLPGLEWSFPNAQIGMYATESKPDFPPVKTAPKGSPNILLVCDDYAAKGPFPVTGTIDSVTFMFGNHAASTGMDRLKMATRMD